MGSRLRLLLCGGVCLLGAPLLTPQPASAQFFWDRPQFSADDAARAAMERGFQPLHRPFRNNDVYVADVIDRRGRRERLIISGDSGDILQRFYLGGSGAVRQYADPSIPAGPRPPGRIPETNDQPNVFSRLFGGGGDDDQNDGGAGVPRRVIPAPIAPKPHVKRPPRIVERAPETVRPLAPVESAPLAPAGSKPGPANPDQPSPGGDNPAAAAPQTGPVASTPPASADKPQGQGRSISRDPLAIPGTREEDEKSTRSTASASPAAASRPAAPDKPAAAPVPPKPAAPPAPKGVPVAPLD